MDRFVSMPNLEIYINRESDGCYVLKAACEGEFRTENYNTAMSVLSEWMNRADDKIKKLQLQYKTNGETPSENGKGAAVAGSQV